MAERTTTRVSSQKKSHSDSITAHASRLKGEITEQSVGILTSTTGDLISSDYSGSITSSEEQVSSESMSSSLDVHRSSDSLPETQFSKLTPEVQFNKVLQENSLQIYRHRAILLIAAIAFFIAAVIHITMIIAFLEIYKSRAHITRLERFASNMASYLNDIREFMNSEIKFNMTLTMNKKLSAEVGRIELNVLEQKNSIAAKLASVDNITSDKFKNIYSTFSQITSIYESVRETNIGNLRSEDIINILDVDGYVFTSCANIFKRSDSAQPGYYKLRALNGSTINAYCVRSCGGNTGGWMRVADVDMTNNDQRCPPGLRFNESALRSCKIPLRNEPSCSSDKFSVNGIRYSNVCGRISAFQIGTPDAFGNSNPSSNSGRETNRPNIETYYVDGVSVTHGAIPRKHIWTFAAANDETNNYPAFKCACINPNINTRQVHIPPFVGEDYFCGTGTGNKIQGVSVHPLWDGSYCGMTNTCCTFNNPPWFFKKLTLSTADDIEMRVCRDEIASNEDFAIHMIKMFVQ